MTNAKLAVDPKLLAKLLKKIGREDLVPVVMAEVEDGEVTSLAHRNEWICLLAADPRVSSQEIADCFFDDEGKALTRARVGQVAKENAVRLAPKPKKTAQWEIARERLKELESEGGRRLAEAVMRRAAADPTYWIVGWDGRWKRLNRERVLTDLGFPTINIERLRTEIWRELRERQIITEDTRVGVAVRYGLNVDDPTAYVWEMYHREGDPTLDDASMAINKELRRQGLIIINRPSLVCYMRTRRDQDREGGTLTFKSRGHNRADRR